MLEALQNAFFQTGDALTTWLSAFSSFLWGWPLLIMLLGTHLYLTVIPVSYTHLTLPTNREV